MTLYAQRDPRALEPHLSRHMEAMTSEGLRDKGAIACELAWRDAEIERLLERIATAYGYLWHANDEPGTPNRYGSEKAAIEARKVLREILTGEQRGKGIIAARAAIVGADMNKGK